MIGVALRAGALTAVYLLVLTSAAPGDVLVGALLGLAVALALGPRGRPPATAPGPARVLAATGMLAETALEIVRGSWRTARFCLGGRADPGLVEIPRGDRSPGNVAMWGVLTGEAPDEYPVAVEHDVLIVHVLDARDPEAVRARHARAFERRQRKVLP
jgi:multisubunit Na+/H+ antiporter MnhE subunit